MGGSGKVMGLKVVGFGGLEVCGVRVLVGGS